VERITDETRIVLQFDVNVPGERSPNEGTGDIPDGSGKPVLDTLKPLFLLSEADANHDAILEGLVGMIQNLHTSQSINEVVFPLKHLYRLASITPEYLKGVDGCLYEGLKKKFEVDLKPVVLIHKNYEGHWDLDEALAYPFVSVHDEQKGDNVGGMAYLGQRHVWRCNWVGSVQIPGSIIIRYLFNSQVKNQYV